MASLLVWIACTASDGGQGNDSEDTGTLPAVPEFGHGAPVLTTVGTAADGLDVVRDLEFQPDDTRLLWTVNQAIDGTVIYTDPGSPEQESLLRIDAHADHFMEEVSSIAFGAPGTFATCQESKNTYNDTVPANGFMGPALWPDDLDVYGEVDQGWNQLGSHIDMLHESPLCMGIAWDHDNVYWVFDGFYERLVRYDFEQDHGPGNDDHSDGIVHSYDDVELDRVEGVPGHLILDHETGLVYVADTGTGRVLRIDPSTASFDRDLPQRMEAIAEYSRYLGATVDVFASGLHEPSGIDLSDGRVFVSEHATGDIVAFDAVSQIELGRVATGAAGVMGIAHGPDGAIWYVDADANEVVRIDPQ